MNNKKVKLGKWIGIVTSLIVATTGVVFAKDIGNYFINLFGANASDGVETAVRNGYVEQVKTDYIEADGIEVSIDSFIIDDFNFDINFKIKANEKYDIESMKGIKPIDLKVLNENNEVVFIAAELNLQIAMENKTAGTPNYKPLFYGGYGITSEVTGENELILHVTANGSEEHKIRKAKKLYVSFSKLQNIYTESEIYTGNWNYELDVPEEMYNRDNIIYRIKSCSEKTVQAGNAILSNTAFKISLSEIITDKVDFDLLHVSPPKSILDMIALNKEYVETSDGKKFETSQRSDGDGGYGVHDGERKIINYHQTFNLTKFDATDELKVHLFTNKGEEIIIEYERIN